MSILDSCPTVEEILERYGDDGTREPRDDYDYNMLPVEYEEVYCSQFSYELALIIYTRYRTVAEEPIEYDVYDYHFNAKLGLGVHKKIGFAVVFHRDARKNFIIPLRLFERYAQAICSKIKSFTEAIRCQQAKDEIVRHLEWDCEVGEPGFEHGRGRISPQSKPIQALPIHFGFGCDCGIIRRQFGELSRHPCIQKDTIRPVAYQKFPQVKGRMAANFEVYCPTYGGYVEDRARMKRGSKVPSSVASSSSNAPVLNVRTTNVPNLQHHPLVKRILQEVDCDAVDTQVSGMKEASMVAKIAQLLVGAQEHDAYHFRSVVRACKFFCSRSVPGRRARLLGRQCAAQRRHGFLHRVCPSTAVFSV